VVDVGIMEGEPSGRTELDLIETVTHRLVKQVFKQLAPGDAAVGEFKFLAESCIAARRSGRDSASAAGEGEQGNDYRW